MFLIDQGEKKLIKRTLLDENGDPIPWEMVVDIRFDLTIGGSSLKTYSKENGDVKQSGTDVSFQLTQEDTRSLPPITYDLKVSIDVYDDRFDGLMTDTQWQYGFSSIRLNIDRTFTYNESIDTGSIKFAVIPEHPPEESEPVVAPAIGEPETTYDSLSISFSPVNQATGYDYQLESDQIIVNNGSSLTVELTGLTQNTTDQIRIRGKNNIGEGPWSDYKSFTTNPNVVPNVSIETTLTSAEFTISNNDGYEIEINDGDSWVNYGNVSQVTLSNLEQGTQYTHSFRFRNAGGIGPIIGYSFTTKELPESPPIILDTEAGPGVVSVDITLVMGITGVEYRLDAGTPVDVGLTNQFDVTTGTPEQTYNFEVRYYNDFGGGPWSDVIQITPLEIIPPTISDTNLTTSATDSDYTVTFTKATDNNTDSTALQYFLVEGSLEQVSDEELIEELTPVVSGVDVSEFTVNRGQGFESDINVYVKDEAGNIALYTSVEIRVLDPEITDIETTPTSIIGNVGDTGSISWEVISNGDTTEDQELATPSSSNTDSLVLSNIDKQAGTADYELVGSGIGNINIVSDFDGYTEQIPFETSEYQEVQGTESEPHTFDVV